MTEAKPPQCPACDITMCEQFDQQGRYMIPNGTFICYLCGCTAKPKEIQPND